MSLHTPDVAFDASFDLLVIGGGLAGVCAAIAAARNGCSVALLHDRPVLGGNSSSEVRVHIGGADAHASRRHARESGIIEELRLEDRLRNHEPTANGRITFVWDHVLLSAVWSEPNISLYLNTSAQQAIMADPETIAGVLAYQTSTFRTLALRGAVVIDASGDGQVAADAGAHFRMGREGRSEFGEPAAPQRPDHLTLGSSILFCVRDIGRPAPFSPPPWAHDFPSDDHLPFRNHDNFAHAGFWWIEYGGTLDTIADNETIRDRLLAYVLGIWDHIKNHGDHGAQNFVLDWVGAVPGKRESRRFIGDHILTQSDLTTPAAFDDAVAYGGWSIDLHPPEGIHSNEPPATFVPLPKVYPIPFASLYSRNIRNLMFAGRNISASHVAFGSTRLMATAAVMGQAVGTAAALCKRYDATPRAIRHNHISDLQQTLLRDDAYIPGLRNLDPRDIARLAHAAASSSAELKVEQPDAALPLSAPRAQLFPISANRLDTIDLLLESARDQAVELAASLHWTAAYDDFANSAPVATARAFVPPHARTWVPFEFDHPVKPHGLYFVALGPTDGVSWCTSDNEPPGTQRATGRDDGSWRYLGEHGTHCFRITPPSRPFEPENVLNGIARPEGWPNIWISDPTQPLPQSLTLDFGAPRTIATVLLTFDTNLNHLPDFGPAPECVRDYALLARRDGQWHPLLDAKGNYQRRRTHSFDPIETTALRIEILATNGAPTARLYEVRAYPPHHLTECSVAHTCQPVQPGAGRPAHGMCACENGL